MSSEFAYIALLFGLFVVPRLVQRIRIPSAITCLAIGAGFALATTRFQDDPTIRILATFGIVSLFLFAGLEVAFHELRAGSRILVQHLIARALLLAIVALAAALVFRLDVRPAALLALALLTPSAGFILDSIARFDLSPSEKFWVKSKVIATELVALAVLFVVLQSSSAQRLGLATVALLALVFLLPMLFRAFAAWIVPHAPKSEFAFLLMLAVMAAFVTKSLGVYYLVGAFMVGMAAQQLRERLPAMTSEQMLHAIEVFASLFVPFYFFQAGLGFRQEDFSREAFLTGGLFLLLTIPLRIGSVVLHRRIAMGESWREGIRIGVLMLPTLVFTLVIAQILRDRFAIEPAIFGGLILYALANTIVPGFVIRMAQPSYEDLHLPRIEEHEGDGL